MTAERLEAARHRARTGIAARLAGRTFTDETAAQEAAHIVACMEADEWSHRAAHTAAPPPPAHSDPPSDAYRQARQQLAHREAGE